MTNLPLLGYWNCRGLAQPIRLILEYTGTEYDEKRYEFGAAPHYKEASAWPAAKRTLDVDFPNIPYYVDGKVKLTHNLAIMRYIARKNKLDGQSEDEKQRIDLAEQQLVDFRAAYVRFCYDAQHDDIKPAYLDKVDKDLALFSAFLATRPWFAGNGITYVDFLLYEMLNQHRMLSPTVLDKFDNLRSFLVRFESLPAISSYMTSERFLKRPLNGDWAKFGGK